MSKKPTKEIRVILATKQDYTGLLNSVSELLEQARHAAARSVNQILTVTYWEVGRRIVEYEQVGEIQAEYGMELLKCLGKDLTKRFGRGFSWRNLYLMRKFYLAYPKILQTVSAKSLTVKKTQTSSDLLLSKKLHSPARMTILQSVSGEFPLSWSHYVRLIALDDEAP